MKTPGTRPDLGHTVAEMSMTTVHGLGSAGDMCIILGIPGPWLFQTLS